MGHRACQIPSDCRACSQGEWHNGSLNLLVGLRVAAGARPAAGGRANTLDYRSFVCLLVKCVVIFIQLVKGCCFYEGRGVVEMLNFKLKNC